MEEFYSSGWKPAILLTVKADLRTIAPWPMPYLSGLLKVTKKPWGAAYKGIIVLIKCEGAEDFFWKGISRSWIATVLTRAPGVGSEGISHIYDCTINKGPIPVRLIA